MDQNHFTTDTLRKKGAHLTFEERVIIQTRLRDKQSMLGRPRQRFCSAERRRKTVLSLDKPALAFYTFRSTSFSRGDASA